MILRNKQQVAEAIVAHFNIIKDNGKDWGDTKMHELLTELCDVMGRYIQGKPNIEDMRMRAAREDPH